mmetsp:Transcript_125699/g.352035  ORF Transcript_125699/g.352035 Transcript_125699/m.352035 type:complete len:205 (+) Transcript_125699:111-725(+)
MSDAELVVALLEAAVDVKVLSNLCSAWARKTRSLANHMNWARSCFSKARFPQLAAINNMSRMARQDNMLDKRSGLPHTSVKTSSNTIMKACTTRSMHQRIGKSKCMAVSKASKCMTNHASGTKSTRISGMSALAKPTICKRNCGWSTVAAAMTAKDASKQVISMPRVLRQELRTVSIATKEALAPKPKQAVWLRQAKVPLSLFA